MYPLATYLREIRQDWPMPTIQSALADVNYLPYEAAAVAAVRVATTPGTQPREITKEAKRGAQPQRPVIPAVCRTCGRVHPAEQPHPRRDADTNSRGAAAARAALTGTQ